MVFSLNLKTLGIICLVLILLFLISAYKRPSKEYFENLATLSVMESKANYQLQKAFKLQDTTKIALGKCKQLGLNIPDQIYSLFSGKNKDGNYVIENFTSGIIIDDLSKTVNTILSVEVPKTLTPTEVNEAEKAKVEIANALVASEEAKLANVSTELARSQVTSDVKTIQDIPVTEAVKTLPEVQVVAAKLEEKTTELQKVTEDASKMSEKAKEVASDTKATSQEIAEAQKDADILLAKAATLSAEAAQAKLELTTTISKLDTNAEVQKDIQAVLETDTKAAEVAKGIAVAAESRAQVSNAEANLTELQKKINEAKSPKEKKLAMEEYSKANEEFRQKIIEDTKKAEEAQKKQAEELAKQIELENKKKQEMFDLQAYASKTLNTLAQTGILSINSDLFNTVSSVINEAKSKEEIDTIVEKTRADVLAKRKLESDKETLVNKRAEEIIAALPKLYFTTDELNAIYKIPDEDEYQRKKAEIISYTQKRIKEEQDKRDEENNKRNAEADAKSKARLAELMAMSPIDRYQTQLNETKERQLALTSAVNQNFENYKAKVIRNLMNTQFSLPNDVIENLKKLPTYKQFDEAFREERIKRENATQRLNREAEEARFEEYKKENIATLIANNAIFNDEKTINELKNATNADEYDELSQIALGKKKTDDLANRVDDPDGSKALYAKNMEPSRSKIVDEAYQKGFLLDENQYKRLKTMSINTSEKFQSLLDEIKKTQRDIVDAREAEAKRKREEEEKARQDAILAEKKAKEDSAQAYFLERRSGEVRILVNDVDMPISKEMEQDLLNTNDRKEFYRKVDIYKEQAAGGVRQPGESLEDFLFRRAKELETERLKKNQSERDKYLDKENYEVPLNKIIKQNQDIIDSPDPDITRFPREEAKNIIKIINDLKARNFETHKARYDEYLRIIQREKDKFKAAYSMKPSDQFSVRKATIDAKLTDADKKFNESQEKVLTGKDKYGNDIKYYRFFKYTSIGLPWLNDKTAQECVDEISKNPNGYSFWRGNNVKNEDKAACYLNERTDSMINTKLTDTPANVNTFVRNDLISDVEGAETIFGASELAAAANLTKLNSQKREEAMKKEAEEKKKREEEEAKRKEAEEKRKREEEEEKKKKEKEEQRKMLLAKSQIFTIGGKKYRVFMNSTMPRVGGSSNNTQIGAAISMTLDDTVKRMNELNGKSFGRITWGRRWNDEGTALITEKDKIDIPRTNGHIFNSSDPYLITEADQYAVYIPLENLTAEFQETTGFRDYSSHYSNQRQYVVNQNAYLNRSTRAFNYSMFHPAL